MCSRVLSLRESRLVTVLVAGRVLLAAVILKLVDKSSAAQARFGVAQFLCWPHLMPTEFECVQPQRLWFGWRHSLIRKPSRSPLALPLSPLQAHSLWLRIQIGSR